MLLGAVLAIVLHTQGRTATVNVSISPTPASVIAGQNSFVDLIGTYDGVDRILGGAISLNFRADLLEVVGVTLRAPSDVGGSTGNVVQAGANGTVNAIGFASFAGVTGTFNLATIEFRALGPIGVSVLTAFDPGDPVFVWVNEGSQLVTVTSTPSMLEVSPIPEPATYTLWLLGLGGLIGASLARRR